MWGKINPDAPESSRVVVNALQRRVVAVEEALAELGAQVGEMRSQLAVARGLLASRGPGAPSHKAKATLDAETILKDLLGGKEIVNLGSVAGTDSENP